MHDIRAIRTDPAVFDAGLARRALPPRAAELIALDERRRALATEEQTAQARRNEASKEIGQAKARKDEARASALLAEPARAAACGDDVNGERIACSCGDTIVSDTRLRADDPVVVERCRTDGLIVRAPAGALTLRLDLGGRVLTGDGLGTGIRVLSGGSRGAVIIGGVYDNSLQLHQFGFKDGAFWSHHDINLIQTKNKAFRPCDVRIGPDGAVYFADWYNVIVGHYQASYRHPDRDLVHGRIWRVVRKGRPLVQPVALAGADLATLFEQLEIGRAHV